MRTDDQDPQTYTDSYLQQRNPLTLEGLVQLTMGAPLPVYNGGHLMAAVRHFDPISRRPGLPADVGALVEKVEAGRVGVRLANLSPLHPREVILQAGAYGEHRFGEACDRTTGAGGPWNPPQTIDAPLITVDLPPGSEIALELTLERFVNDPAYTMPWDR
jgi:hypothetical protein